MLIGAHSFAACCPYLHGGICVGAHFIIVKEHSMAKKKQKTGKVEVRLPVPLLVFYEGVAAYSGVSIKGVINVMLAVHMLQRSSQQHSEQHHE